ncbi:MAG: MFS transporter [Thermoplasmata archaeon]|jgi:major facilitator 4 family protein
MNKLKSYTIILTAGYMFILMSSQAIWVTFSPVVSYVAMILGTSVELVGILAILYPTFFLILTIPSGILLDKNFKFWFTFGVVTTVFAGVARYAFENYWWLFLSQLFGAIGQPFLLNGIVPFSTFLFNEKRRTMIISILSFSMYFGTILSLAIGTTLYFSGGIYLLMMPSAILGMIGLIFIMVSILKIKFEKMEEKSVVKKMSAVIKRKDLWLIALILGFGVAVFDNLSTWLEPALRDVNLENVAGSVVAIAIILGLIGTIVIPRMVTKKNSRTLYLRSVTVIISIFFITLIFFINGALLFVLLGISGFLMIPAYPIIMDWIGRYNSKDVQGSATGFVGLISRIVSVVLTLSAMYFIYNSKIYFAFLTSSLILAFIVSLFLKKDKYMEAYIEKNNSENF